MVSSQDKSKSQNILMIIVIIQVIILIGLSIRKKKQENNYIKLPTDKLSINTFAQKQKFMNITWIVIGIGIIVSIFLFYLFKKVKPSPPPVASHVPTFSLTVSNTSIKDANGEYTMIGNQLYQGKKFRNPDGEEVYMNGKPVYWSIKNTKNNFSSPSFSSNGKLIPYSDLYNLSWKNCKNLSIVKEYEVVKGKPTETVNSIIYIFNNSSPENKLYVLDFNTNNQLNWTYLPEKISQETLVDTTSDNEYIYLLTEKNLYQIFIDVSQGKTNNWGMLSTWFHIEKTILLSFKQQFVINSLNTIYTIVYKNTDLYIYKLDKKELENYYTLKNIDSQPIACLAIYNMLVIFTVNTIYYFDIQTYIYQSILLPSEIPTINSGTQFTTINNYILINTNNQYYLFNIFTEEISSILPSVSKLGQSFVYYNTKKLIILQLSSTNPPLKIAEYSVTFTNDGIYNWIIAPLTFDKNIYQNFISPNIFYMVLTKTLLCNNNNKFWGIYNSNAKNLEKIIFKGKINGSGCTHSFIPQPTEHQSTKQQFIKYKTEKIIFSIILGVELLILLIVGSRKYLKLDKSINFFNSKFIILLILSIGIGVAVYSNVSKLTAEHVLRIIIGSQICILSLLALRKYK